MFGKLECGCIVSESGNDTLCDIHNPLKNSRLYYAPQRLTEPVYELDCTCGSDGIHFANCPEGILNMKISNFKLKADLQTAQKKISELEQQREDWARVIVSNAGLLDRYSPIPGYKRIDMVIPREALTVLESLEKEKKDV